MDKKTTNLSRRRFIRNVGIAGVVAGAASAVNVFDGLGTSTAKAATDSMNPLYAAVMKDSGRIYARKAKCPGPKGNIAFEGRLISAGEFTEHQSCDVVVVGGGIAGIHAALKAADLGANVILLEKMSEGRGCCECSGGFNSKIQITAGHDLNEAGVTKYKYNYYEAAQWRIRPDALETYMKCSGAAIDFSQEMFDKGNNGGYKYTPYTKYEVKMFVPKLVSPPAGLQGIYFVRELTRIAKEVEPYSSRISIQMNTPAIQLIRDNNGPVTGVIAKNKNGYFKINASKGVILASGGYDANPEMMEAFCRAEDYATSGWRNPYWGTTGDGHMMGLQVGASMDSLPHTVMNFQTGVPDGVYVGLTGIGNSGLYINGDGKRFVDERRSRNFKNEDHTAYVSNDAFQYVSNAVNAQAGFGKNCWIFFDKPFYDKFTAAGKESFAKYEHNGWANSAGTVKELATKCGINPEALENTVNKFNSYAVGETEPDFGRIIATGEKFVNAPYYAVKNNSSILATTSGLMIDGNCNVLDTGDKVIEGLYAAGNASGNMFYGNYPRQMSGASIGRAITFGYVAAEHACNRR